MINTSFKKKQMKLAVLSGLLAVAFSLSAPAALYGPFTSTSSGPIPQDGTTFSSTQTVSTLPAYVITSVELILTFNDSVSLTGSGSSGIQGLLDLGTGSSSPSVSFSPSISRAGTGSQEIYDMTFSGAQPSGFNNLNPNDTWALVLYDLNNNGIENGLVSWTLNITAVPEPVNCALAVFGLMFVGTGAARYYLARRRSAKAG
jgi:hypothetical protein